MTEYNTDALNALRDGIFQISMSLYSEYNKYLEEKDARNCVAKDLLDNSKKFVDNNISGCTQKESMHSYLRDILNELNKNIKTLKGEELWKVTEKILILEEVLKFI